LKAFEKIFLQPGEHKTVSLKLKVADMAFYNDKINSWVVEPGEFVLHVGTSSRDIISDLPVMVK